MYSYIFKKKSPLVLPPDHGIVDTFHRINVNYTTILWTPGMGIYYNKGSGGNLGHKYTV